VHSRIARGTQPLHASSEAEGPMALALALASKVQALALALVLRVEALALALALRFWP